MSITTPTDPLDALRRLTPAQVESRLADIRAEDAALRTILRSLLARERERARRLHTTPDRTARQEAQR